MKKQNTPRVNRLVKPCAILLLGAGMFSGCSKSTAPALPDPPAGPSAFIDDSSDFDSFSSFSEPTTPLAPTISEVKDWSDRFDADPSSYQNGLRFAQMLIASGSVERAIEVIEDSLTHHPADPELLFIQAQAHLNNGDTARAIRALDTVEEKNADWRHHSLRGISLDQTDRHEQARNAYKRALRLSPGNAKIYNNLGLSYALSGDPEQAETVLRQAMSLDGSNPQIRQNLALVLGAQGKFTEAEKISAKDLPPDQVRDNLDYYRWLLTPRRVWDQVEKTTDPASSSPLQPRN